jgi:hypothetical protein
MLHFRAIVAIIVFFPAWPGVGGRHFKGLRFDGRNVFETFYGSWASLGTVEDPDVEEELY